jgi:predicted transposase
VRLNTVHEPKRRPTCRHPIEDTPEFIQGKTSLHNKEDREKLIKLMRKQSSAIRVAYNMLKELEKEKKKKQETNTPKYTKD